MQRDCYRGLVERFNVGIEKAGRISRCICFNAGGLWGKLKPDVAIAIAVDIAVAVGRVNVAVNHTVAVAVAYDRERGGELPVGIL